MKRFLVIILFLFSAYSLLAQEQDAKQLYATAKKLMMQADYDNAVLVLNSAIKQDPNNLEMLQDLSYISYLKRDFAKSIELSKTLIARPDAEEQTFQLLGMAYKAIAEYKECDKMYKQALKKFPKSGVLYNESGELMALQKNMNGAIVQWEKGIELDPEYSGNYFNASNYYALNDNIFYEIIYGEIFLNLESYSTRSADVKGLLLEAYIKLYAPGNLSKLKSDKKNSAFEQLFIATLAKSSSLASEGVTAENLTAIRTRFVLDWFGAKNDARYPYRLFSHQQYLLREGMFDAYNQWIFGAANSPSAYQVWIDVHDKQAVAFKQFQQSRVFKVPAGQNYR